MMASFFSFLVSFLLNPLYLLVSVLALLLFYYFLRIFFINGTKCPSKARIDGKTVVITGGNTGIGKLTALDLASRGGRVIIACRDVTKGASAVSEIKQTSGNEDVFFRSLDLASTESIRAFSEKLLVEEDRLDILILNAGVMFTPYSFTKEGFELQFGVNHLGHFLLTHLLLERLKQCAPSRVVVVSSLAHVVGTLDFEDMMWTKRYSAQLSYCRSKLANIMFARELAKRVSGSGITVCSLHPGTVYTEITRYLLSGWLILIKPLAHLAMLLFTKTPEQGAQTSVYCAVAREVEGQEGAYYDNCCIKKPVGRALREEDCRRLWDYSMKALKLEQ